jgi:hypothetical protein
VLVVAATAKEYLAAPLTQKRHQRDSETPCPRASIPRARFSTSMSSGVVKDRYSRSGETAIHSARACCSASMGVMDSRPLHHRGRMTLNLIPIRNDMPDEPALLPAMAGFFALGC